MNVTDFPALPDGDMLLRDKIAAQVISLVHSGQLRPGDRIPSERALGEHWGVDRLTARAGLESSALAAYVEVVGQFRRVRYDAPTDRDRDRDTEADELRAAMATAAQDLRTAASPGPGTGWPLVKAVADRLWMLSCRVTSTDRTAAKAFDSLRCEANAHKGTGTGMCGFPLDAHGQCERASRHVTE